MMNNADGDPKRKRYISSIVSMTIDREKTIRIVSGIMMLVYGIDILSDGFSASKISKQLSELQKAPLIPLFPLLYDLSILVTYFHNILFRWAHYYHTQNDTIVISMEIVKTIFSPLAHLFINQYLIPYNEIRDHMKKFNITCYDLNQNLNQAALTTYSNITNNHLSDFLNQFGTSDWIENSKTASINLDNSVRYFINGLLLFIILMITFLPFRNERNLYDEVENNLERRESGSSFRGFFYNSASTTASFLKEKSINAIRRIGFFGGSQQQNNIQQDVPAIPAIEANPAVAQLLGPT